MTHNLRDVIASEREWWPKLNLEGGLPMVEIARRFGFARSTLYLWKKAYGEYGFAVLAHDTGHEPVNVFEQHSILLKELGGDNFPIKEALGHASSLESRHGLCLSRQEPH